jgi:predicted amidohydrolase
VLYSREAPVAKVIAKIHELGREGVQFATFPETVVPYYPYFALLQAPHDADQQAQIVRDTSRPISGGSFTAIVSPSGELLGEPLRTGEGLVIAELDFAQIIERKHKMHSRGHDSRPGALSLATPSVLATQECARAGRVSSRSSRSAAARSRGMLSSVSVSGVYR